MVCFPKLGFDICSFSEYFRLNRKFMGNYMSIDEIDRNILKALQDNCRQSISDIAEKVGLSTSACHRRIGILEDGNIIERYAARLNGEALGYAMTFYVEVTLEGQSETILSAFEKAALSRPEVLECHLMTGDADYLLKVAAPSTVDYEKIYRRTIAALPHVSRIKSALVMKTVKRWTGYPPK